MRVLDDETPSTRARLSVVNWTSNSCVCVVWEGVCVGVCVCGVCVCV